MFRLKSNRLNGCDLRAFIDDLVSTILENNLWKKIGKICCASAYGAHSWFLQSVIDWELRRKEILFWRRPCQFTSNWCWATLPPIVKTAVACWVESSITISITSNKGKTKANKKLRQSLITNSRHEFYDIFKIYLSFFILFLSDGWKVSSFSMVLLCYQFILCVINKES